jgi:hypothetical protein
MGQQEPSPGADVQRMAIDYHAIQIENHAFQHM